MKIYNTLTKKIEEFIPYKKDVVTMYTCGPTVYNYAHIGNMRTYMYEDVLQKTLEYVGYKVKRVMNITDVGHLANDSDDGEDKMEVAAKKQKKSALEIAAFYTEQILIDFEKLNIKKPEVIAKATDHIEEYIKMIEVLLEKEIAYISNGNVYFDITKHQTYYDLSGRDEKDLKIAVREDVTEDNGKKNPFDFGLWFTNSKFNNQELKWDSPWGVGYPGWHIECSSIAIKYLGPHLDIHCGAVDNVFPHHSNEIAQSECCLGHKWCNYWVHGEWLIEEAGKMSKSSGEFLTLALLEEKGFDPLTYRFFCLKSHYRKQLLFSFENLRQIENEYKKLINKINSLTTEENSPLESATVLSYQSKFRKQLREDLNTSKALTVLFDLIKDKEVNNKTKLYLIKDFDYVLGLNLITTKQSYTNDEEIIKQINLRNKLKKEKQFKEADEIREQLKLQGIELIDTREGTSYKLMK